MAPSPQRTQIRVRTVKLISKLLKPLVDENLVGNLEAQEITANLRRLAEQGELLPKTQEVRLLTGDQVSEILAIGKSNLDKLLREGRINLKRIQIGTSVRYRSDDVQRLILSGDMDDVPNSKDSPKK